MELKEDTRYTYAVARIRALETHFLTPEGIQRIVESQDASTAWRETAGWHLFPKGELGIHTPEDDLEKFLTEEIRNTNNLILSLSQDTTLTNLFFLKYDFHNLKVLLKGSSEKMVDLGLIPAEKLRDAIFEKNFRELPHLFQKTINEILFDIQDDKHLLFGRPDIIDILLDRKMFELIFRTIEENPAPSSLFLKILFQVEVDINNLNICSRFKNLKRTKDFLKEALLDGGNLSRYNIEILKKYEKSKDEEFQEFINYHLSILKHQLNNLYESTRYTAFGLEPLVAFLKKREKEAMVIRMIILAKLQNLTAQEIWKEISSFNA